MKKIVLLSVMLLLVISSSIAQPTITKNDMPKVGDTIRINTTTSTHSDNYDSAGINHLWNFSNLTSSTQSVDTFMNILSTSIVYYVDFYSANLAGTLPNMIPFSVASLSLSITNVYGFFNNSTSSYSQLGFGAKFNGVPLPVKYNNPDVQLVFPLTFGEKDSCDFSYNVTIPSLGYYGEKEHRVNYIDGWGTVIIPNDTFQAMRVLSVITAHDTIYLDTMGGHGFSFNYVESQYKWYANGMGIPVMEIDVRTGTGAGTTITYPYFPKNTAGTKDMEAPIYSFSLYPNPTNGNTELYFSLTKPSQVEISITDLLGRNIKTIASKEFHAGYNSVPLDISGMNIGKGIYFVRVSSGNSSKVIKLEVF